MLIVKRLESQNNVKSLGVTIPKDLKTGYPKNRLRLHVANLR
jgi:hypothetical protein